MFKIVIPYFCLVMRDLTSLKDGIPNKFDNGHINFEVYFFQNWFFNLKPLMNVPIRNFGKSQNTRPNYLI